MKTKELSQIALMTSLLVVLGFIPAIPLPFIAVPLTLQNLGVMLVNLFLGSKNGSLSMVLFFLLGLIFPVFSGKATSIPTLMGPTGGYVLAWLLVPLLFGYLSSFLKKQSFLGLFGMMWLAGVLFVDLLGAVWLSQVTEMALSQSLISNLVFIPGDTVKALIATILAYRLSDFRA